MKPNIAILDAVEDARWVELFSDAVNDGMSEDDADAEAYRVMLEEFPRLRAFDGFAPGVAE